MAKNREAGSQSGGVNFGNKGNVKIGGDVVSGDKITTNFGNVAGNVGGDVNAAALVELTKAFKEINRKIDARPENPDVDKDELKETVNKIQEEVKKGEQANPTKVERWLKSLLGMANDIFQVTAATLTNPALGISTAVKLIAEKAKSGG